MVRGSFKYVPKELLDELDRTKINFSIKKDADCFREIANNSKIGRELKITLRGKRGKY